MLRKKLIIASCFVFGALQGALNADEIKKVSIDAIASPAISVTSGNNASLQEANHGEAIVIMKKGYVISESLKALSQAGDQIQRRSTISSSHDENTVTLVSGNISTKDLVNKLEGNSKVKSVSENYSRTINALPNDPRFSDLWAMNNSGQKVNEKTGTAGADINAAEAWDIDTGSDAVIAVLDTGVFYQHEDLVANMWINAAEVAGDGIDNDGNGFVDDIYGYDFAAELNGANDSDPSDIDGHGTQVAGIIGAKGNNGIGVSGINWDIKIMALKVFRPNMQTRDSDIIEAINYILMMKQRGVNIVAVNASYGSPSGSQKDPMNEAIKSLGRAGIVFVAAAGNNGSASVHYPAAYDAKNIVSVAATDQNDALAETSNYSFTSVDLAAPGTNILTTTMGIAVVTPSILNDDIESGDSNWVATGTWAVTEDESMSATHAWSDSPDGNYADKSDTSLTSATDIDLSTKMGQDIGLGMCMKYDIEDGWDYLYVEVSGDSGTNWNTLKAFTGTDMKWGCYSYAIPETVKTAHFKMRFRLKTDMRVAGDGAYIDNIGIGSITPQASTYAFDDSTSMAAPHVTGSIALIAKQFPDETIPYRVNRVLSGAYSLASLSEKVAAGGRLDISKAIDPNLVYKPMISEADKTIGLIAGSSVTLQGMEFGASKGKIFFKNGHGSKVEAEVQDWSDTKITLKVPKGAGQYITVESSSQNASINSVKGNAWKQVAPLSAGKRTFATAVSYEDKIYVFGGVGPEETDTSEVYNPVTNTWSLIAPMPTSRYLVSATVLNNKIYLVGGIDASTRNATDITEVYDPATDTWETDTIAPLPNALYAGEAIAMGGSLYYVGGAAGRSDYRSTLLKHNQADNTWSEKASMTIPRITHKAVVHEGKLYVFGGHQGGLIIHKTTEVYDPANDTWTTVADMPITLWFPSATLSNKGITIAGGDMHHHNDSNKVMHYNPSNDTWTEENGSLNELPKSRVASSLVFLRNRGYYLIGGGRKNRLASVEYLLENNPPVANNDVATVDERSSVDIPVLDNDSDGDGGSPKITSVTKPQFGIATINGDNIIYQSKADFSVSGTDTFSYTITDITGAKTLGNVTVTVNALVGDDDDKSSGGSFDIMFFLMMALSLYYPLRRKYFK